MQACSLGGGDSLGSHGPPPLVLASPNTKHKLLLLERRLTGSCHAPGSSNQAASTAADAKPPALNATDSERMFGEALAGVQDAAKPPVEVVVIPDTQEDDMMHDLLAPAAPAEAALPAAATAATAAASGSVLGRRKSPTPPLSSGEVPSSASKRRKTGKPQHRPAADAAAGSTAAAADSKAAGNSLPGVSAHSAAAAAAAAANGKDLLQQRDKSARVRASPRGVASPAAAAEGKSAAAAAAAGEAAGVVAAAAATATEPGSSNPPMSPIAGGGHAMPMRTPRSSSKQQGQQQGKGQTNISQFFPSLTDGNSRDSETASLQHHHQQQQQPPSPLKDTAGQQQQQQQRPAAARGATPPPAAVAKAGADSSMQQQSRRSRGSIGSAAGAAAAAAGGGDANQAVAWQQQLAALQQKHQQELELARQEARQREGQLSDQLVASQRQIEALQGMLTAARSSSQEREGVVQAAVSQLVTQLAVAQGNLCRLQLSLDGSRLGGLGLARNGALGFAEVWEDGPVLRELASRKAALQRSREEVELARKALKKRLPPPPKATLAAAAAAAADAASGDASGGSSSSNSSQYISSAEYVMQDEILKVRLSVLRREEEALSKEEERLNQDKMKHLRLLKRLRDEEGSRFQGQPLLHQRYVLLALLGRGGFSEVHKAYDLVGLKFVAVKIHQLNSTWSESRKASYVRHAVREYTIHKALRHSNIVSLTDIFEVDNTTFATVLELCEGGDLEGHLQQHHTLPEREARALIAQVFAGLAYLNRAPNSSSGGTGAGAGGAGEAAGFGPRVIHYDLKPANILFDGLGTVKITDFGLSKVVEDGQTMGMELTSQGAGTYWYLPPECFAAGSSSASMAANRPAGGLLPPGILGSTAGGGVAAGNLAAGAPAGASGAPKISNKVDVWSAGVILYQMLYGRRPFGEGLTQEQIYRDGVMLNARQVQFPAKPAVSAEGRAFLSRCLAYNQEERWDVITAAADPYLQLKR